MSSLHDSSNTEATKGEMLPEKEVSSGERHIIHAEFRQWDAVVPPPEVFAKYSDSERDRILTVAEEESKHRRYTNEKIVDASIGHESKEQNYTLIVVLTVIIGTFIAIWFEKTNAVYLMIGILVTIVPLLNSIAQMIRGMFQNNKNNNDK